MFLIKVLITVLLLGLLIMINDSFQAHQMTRNINQTPYIIQNEKLICNIPNKTVCVGPIRCELKLISRSVQQYNADCILTDSIDKVVGRAILYKRLGAVYHKFLIDVREDICSYLSGKRKSILLDLIKRKVQNYTNIFHECPFKNEIYIRDFEFNALDLPLIPAGQYRLDLMILDERNNLLISVQGYGNVKARGATIL